MQTVKQSLTIILIVLLCTFILNVPMVMADTETTTTSEVATQESTDQESTDQESTDIYSNDQDITDIVLDENGNSVDQGILPDSPLYWWSLLIEKIQIALTSDPAEKAALLQELALERLAEAAVMTEEGQTENAEITLDAFSAKLAEAKDFIETLDPESDEAQTLVKALAERNASNIEVLGNMIMSEKLPPQAAERIFVNAVRSVMKSIDKYDKKTQIQLKNSLKKTTEIMENTDLDEETENTLEDIENTDQTDQTDQTEQTEQTSVSNTDVDEDQDDSSTDADITEENNNKENKQEVVTGQNSNPGQTNKEQKEEKNNNIKNDNTNNNDINNDVSEDGQGDETQKDNNNGSEKNHGGGNGGGKGNKH